MALLSPDKNQLLEIDSEGDVRKERERETRRRTVSIARRKNTQVPKSADFWMCSTTIVTFITPDGHRYVQIHLEMFYFLFPPSKKKKINRHEYSCVWFDAAGHYFESSLRLMLVFRFFASFFGVAIFGRIESYLITRDCDQRFFTRANGFSESISTR